MTEQHPRVLRIAARATECVHTGALLLAAVLLAYNHFRVVTAPLPLDYYEGTFPLITGLIAAGHNPYDVEFQPDFAYVYPPLYNLIVAPFTLVFGNTLLLHRAVNAVLIGLCCVLLAVAARRAGARRTDCAGVAVLLYAALLFYVTPVASTNATGQLFFLASVLLPWIDRWRWRSLAASVACGVLAFYGKQYFLLGPGLVGAYLFLAVSKRRAFAYALAGSALLLGSVAAVQAAGPYFLDNTVFCVRNAVGMIRSTEILARQLVFFAGTYPGLLLLALTGAGASLAARGREPRALISLLRMRIGMLDSPLMAHPPAYPWFCFAGATATIVFSLGLNPGNFMSYLFQLMTPFLLLGVFTLPLLNGPRRALLLPLLWLSLFRAWDILPRDFRFDMSGWTRAREIIAESREVLASPILVMPLIENGKRVHQDGHTFYFRFAENKPRILEPADPERRVGAIWRRYMEDLYRNVRSGRFDAVMLTHWDVNGIFAANPPPDLHVDGREYFERYYELAETFAISLTDRYGGGTYSIQVWRPKPGVRQSPP